MVKTPFFYDSQSFIRSPVALCSSSEDPSFLKVLILATTKKQFFSNFAAPKTHFSLKFQFFSSNFLQNSNSLAPILPKVSSLDPGLCALQQRSLPKSKSSAPPGGGVTYYPDLIGSPSVKQTTLITWNISEGVMHYSLLFVKPSSCIVQSQFNLDRTKQTLVELSEFHSVKMVLVVNK